MPAITPQEVARVLDGAQTKTGGRLGGRQTDPGDAGSLSYEPARRQRLDHYGNGGDGWDDEGWTRDYVVPLRDEVEALLAKRFGAAQARAGLAVDIGEKGHVHIQILGASLRGTDSHPLSRLYELTGYEPGEERIQLAEQQSDLFASKKVPSIEEIWKKHAGPKARAPEESGAAGKCNTELAPYHWLDVSVCVSRGAGKKLPVIRDAADVARTLLQIYPQALTGLQEHIIVLAVDVRMQPVGAVLVAKGGLASATAGIPDILRPVIMLPAKAFMIAHNHPSGLPDPSRDDRILTAVVAKAAASVQLQLLDHLILTANPKVFYSFSEKSPTDLQVRA